MNGLDVLVFTAGIGKMTSVEEEVCQSLDFWNKY